jgi:2-polyprenyl-3-methyl-5-hydroxy-6-metoxy-1,4-benzoquinol methylase
VANTEWSKSTGSGPGVITPDGCAVEFYALLPPRPEAEIVHAAGTPGASVLDLGAGTGRMTSALAALGHRVVAVDESIGAVQASGARGLLKADSQ